MACNSGTYAVAFPPGVLEVLVRVLTALYMPDIYAWVAVKDQLLRCTGFDWDEANAPKIWKKHEVSPLECEQVFFNLPLVAAHDEKHSGTEMRYFVLGQSDAGRRLFVVITVREGRLRVISARDMSRKERKVYESS